LENPEKNSDFTDWLWKFLEDYKRKNSDRLNKEIGLKKNDVHEGKKPFETLKNFQESNILFLVQIGFRSWKKNLQGSFGCSTICKNNIILIFFMFSFLLWAKI